MTTPANQTTKKPQHILAHDISNVLCVLSARTKILQGILQRDQAHLSADVAHQFSCLHRAIRQITALCDDVAQESSSNHVYMSDLQAVVHECCDMAAPLLSQHIRMRIDLSKNRQMVACDALQLNRLLLNLMKNSIESMQACGGELCISAGHVTLSQSDISALWCKEIRQPGEYLYIEVKDQGCGMDAEAFMANPTSTASNKDLPQHGFGLQSVLNIISQYYGLMRLQSQVDQGTCVRVFFPSLPIDVALPQPSSSKDACNKQIKQLVQLISKRSSSDHKPVIHS